MIISCMQMLFVHAGVFLGESEELVGGYVTQHDRKGIQASWGGIDAESGIVDYYVGVGTARGTFPRYRSTHPNLRITLIDMLLTIPMRIRIQNCRIHVCYMRYC